MDQSQLFLTRLQTWKTSSRSTKLTVDLGSSPSLCNVSKERAGSTCHGGHAPTATYYLAADDKHDGTLMAEEATQYQELSSKPKRCRKLWSTWSSVVDGDVGDSARTSLISSVDSCYTADSPHLGCLLATAADTFSGCSL